MNAKDRAVVREAIADLMADECRFTEAVGKLCGLVGITYPAYENLKKPFRSVSVQEIAQRGNTHLPVNHDPSSKRVNESEEK